MCSFILQFLARNKLFEYVLLLALCVRCSTIAPKSSVQIYEQPALKNELQYVTDDFKYEIRSLGNEHKTLAFEVKATNLNLDSMWVDPGDWKLAYSKGSKIYQPDLMQDTLDAIHPLQVSMMYDSLAKKVEANERTARDIGVVIAVLLIVGLLIIIIDSSDSSSDDCDDHCRCHRHQTYYESDYYAYGDYDNADRSYRRSNTNSRQSKRRTSTSQRISNFAARSASIKNEDFDARTLKKGEYRRFKLYFKRFNNIKYIKLLGPSAIPDEESWLFEHAILRY